METVSVVVRFFKVQVVTYASVAVVAKSAICVAPPEDPTASAAALDTDTVQPFVVEPGAQTLLAAEVFANIAVAYASATVAGWLEQIVTMVIELVR